ncbi:MAG: ABC transporter ATP-binding protein, partial [Lactobacillales bacterium]|nr:ABC transporter ATP-binding protein [Lactobacillales bacterium]
MKIKKWRKLISYYKPYKLLFFVDLFCAMMTAVIAVVIPLIIRYLMNEVMFLEKREALKMATICVGVIIMMIFALYACSFVTTYYGHLVGARIEKDMRNELFSHYQKLSLNFYENKKVGELMSRIVVDLENLNEFLHHFPEEVLIFTIRLILVFCIFFSINPLLAFIALWIIIFCISYVIFLIPKVNKTAVQNKEKISDINTQIEDSLSGIRVVKSFANEKIEMRKFKNSSLAFVKSKRNYLNQIAILFSGMNSFVFGLIPIVATEGIYLVINHLM